MSFPSLGQSFWMSSQKSKDWFLQMLDPLTMMTSQYCDYPNVTLLGDHFLDVVAKSVWITSWNSETSLACALESIWQIDWLGRCCSDWGKNVAICLQILWRQFNIHEVWNKLFNRRFNLRHSSDSIDPERKHWSRSTTTHISLRIEIASDVTRSRPVWQWGSSDGERSRSQCFVLSRVQAQRPPQSWFCWL